MGGIRDLATAGLWPLALLVLLASIIVPALKLASLGWCLVAIRSRSARLLRQRTALHRFVKYIGRWSNIDVFVVALVVALVQFGFLATIEPGPGIASFAAVVVLTMIAAEAFDSAADVGCGDRGPRMSSPNPQARGTRPHLSQVNGPACPGCGRCRSWRC